MKSFTFFNPVRVIFGPGEMQQLGKQTAQFGKTCLLVKSQGPLEELGVYSRAKQFLSDAGMKVSELEGVEANPKLGSIYEGIELCRSNNVDIVVAVGGGSPIDCAKGIAVGACDDGDVWDFYTTKRVAEKALPIGVVSTIAATGAEMSVHSVITNKKTKQKYATHYEFNLPKFAIIDTELHTTVPRHLTACGMVDTITHAGENYFAGDNDTGVTDRLAEGIIQTIIESEAVLDDLTNINLRNKIAWAATLAINGLTDCGRGAFEYGAHIIEHSISGLFDVVHGEGLSVVHPAWLEYVCENSPEKFMQFGERVLGIERNGDDLIALGKKVAEGLRNKYASWGMPVKLEDIGVNEDDFSDIADEVINDPDSFFTDRDVVLNVLERCI